MSKVTIKFWDMSRLEWVDPIYSCDYAVNENGEVFHIHFSDVIPHLEPIYYQDGERIA